MKNNYTIDELLPLLAQRVKKYTSNDSTSIPYAKAKQLMNSILYCMDQDVENESSSSREIIVGNNNNVIDEFENGLKRKKKKIDHAKTIFLEIKESFYAYRNLCYYDTVMNGMPAFFENYDVEFDATNHILSLDYPLIRDIQGVTGIDIIYEYLRTIQLEQLFLKKFSSGWIIKMLIGYHEEYSEYILNICKIVLRNVIGCILIDKPINEMIMEQADLEQLKSISADKTLEELEYLLSNVLDSLIVDEYEGNKELLDYLLVDIKEFAYEYKSYSDRDCLERIFSKVEEKTRPIEAWFEDGISMDDATLRKVIDEMKVCRFLSDKLIMLQEYVKGLEDLKEVLKECFFDGEYVEVFKLLTEEELKVLKKDISDKVKINEDLNEWEKVLWELG